VSTPHTGCGSSTHEGDDRKSHLAPATAIRLTRLVRLFALVDRSLLEPIDLYVRREDAERMLAELLHDKPAWESLIWIEEIELGQPSES